MKSKEQKREEAIERQAKHDALDWEGLLLKLDSRPGECRRERRRHNL